MLVPWDLLHCLALMKLNFNGAAPCGNWTPAAAAGGYVFPCMGRPQPFIPLPLEPDLPKP